MSDTLARLEAELTGFTARRSPASLHTAMASGCYIYGAGGYGKRIAALLRANGIPRLGFIDRKFVGGERLDGIPCFHPETLPVSNAEGATLLAGVHNHLVDPAAILEFGRARPFRDVLWNADLPDAFGPAADNYWLTSRKFLLQNFANLRATMALMADEQSVQILLALIRFRITGEPEHASVARPEEQYTPANLLNFTGPITFVDGGAYVGDTHAHLTRQGIAVQNWVAFEPDPANFKALATYAASLSNPSTLFPCGLDEKLAHVPFTANAGAGSHLGTDGPGAISAACVALDDVQPGIRPDYIKLDVEGAEASALQGMRRTITTAHPHLAVSIYHRPQDLWELPAQVARLAPYADLYIRQHCLNAFDTVLYAVPRR